MAGTVMRTWLRGISLVEVLVGMAVGSLVLGCALLAFITTGRLMTWVGAHSDVGSSALLALNRLSRELRASNYATLAIMSSPTPALGFEVEDPTTLNLVTFQPAHYFVAYGTDGQANLVRKSWSGVQPSLSPDPFVGGRLAAGQLALLMTTPNPGDHVVARGIQQMTVTPPVYPTTAVVNGVEVDLFLTRAVNSQQSIQTEVRTTVYPRNHW